MKFFNLGLLGAGLIVAFVIFFSSWYTVDQGYVGIITRNGAVIGVAQPGLGFKVPIIDTVTSMSTQTLTWDWKKANTYSKDVQQVDADLTLNIAMRPGKAVEVFTQYGTDWFHRIVTSNVVQAFKETIGHYNAQEIVDNRDKMALQSRDALQKILGDDFIVYGVQIVNMKFTSSYEQAIEAAAAAQASVSKAQQDLARVRIDAEQRVAQAKADAEATKSRADAAAYATKIQGDAEASAISAKGRALAGNPSLPTLIAAERWNGKLPSTMVPGSAVPFLSVK